MATQKPTGKQLDIPSIAEELTTNSAAISFFDAEYIRIDDSTVTDDLLPLTGGTISGNLTVSGTLTFSSANINDNILTLNSDTGGAPTQDVGLEVERGTSDNVRLVWDESTDKWSVGNSSSLTALSLANHNHSGVYANASHNHAASNITSGTLVDARIPSLNASKTTAGTFNTARIPKLPTSWITSGTFADSYIPSLNASKTTAGTFNTARIPKLPTSWITSGTFASTLISSASVTQHQGSINHDSLSGFVADEHIDWTGIAGQTIHQLNISASSVTQHLGNYVTRSTDQDIGGLKNFTSGISLSVGTPTVTFNATSPAATTLDMKFNGTRRGTLVFNTDIAALRHFNTSAVQDSELRLEAGKQSFYSNNTLTTTYTLSGSTNKMIMYAPGSNGASDLSEIEMRTGNGKAFRIGPAPNAVASYTMRMPTGGPTADGQILRVASRSGQFVNMEWANP